MQNKSKNQILIIDDDSLTSEMYRYALTSAGYSVNIAPTGAQGVMELTTDRYDLVLLDLILPDQSGSDILKHWREIRPRNTRPGIIVLTNYEQDNTNRKILENEADGYVVKAGTTPRKLLKLIASILNK